MPIELYGDTDGEGFTKKGTSIEWATADGTLTVTMADGISLYIKDDAGNVIGRFDENGKMSFIAKVALAALDTAGGVFAWQNPEGASIIITKVVIDVTTVASGAATVDVGTTATNATTLSDNLLDGVDVHTAAGLLGVADGDGTNGKAQQKLASGKWVTGSKASGACAALVGFAYIHYHRA